MSKKLFIAGLCFCLAAYSIADTIELNNGKVLEGTFVSRDGDTIVFDMGGVNMTLGANDVKSINMGSSAASNTSEPAKKVAKSLPAGTILTIKTNDTLDTGKHSTGHQFTATLEGNLSVDGQVIISAGTRVYGKISEAVKARRVAGKAKMMLTLTGFNLDGEMKTITSNSINAFTQATGKSSAAKVARGAAIGALADGSSGAKTGAKVGAGAAILSKGNQVVIPAGTILEFKLAQPYSAK